nr:hypothetical protein [Pseudomonas sp.]
MSDYFLGIWNVLVQVNTFAASNGLMGCAIVLVTGIVMVKTGVSITGQEESFSGTARYGNVVLHKSPAIHGSAKSWLGRLAGQLLKFCGAVLFVTGLLALVNVLLYGRG